MHALVSPQALKRDALWELTLEQHGEREVDELRPEGAEQLDVGLGGIGGYI